MVRYRRASHLPQLAGALLLLGAVACSAGRTAVPRGVSDDTSGIAAVGDVLRREQIDRINASRMEQLFEGRFSGVQVLRSGGGMQLRIRGAGDPLLVIDGIPVGGSQQVFALNPRDIEQIEVLKDAATSAYGVRGADGVVLVTTRRQ